ncbi:hypothetical protein [Sphingobacterium pedocola]|uniref:DUF5018 domain-containing protein n=1 Tax=Sphingobacterium pedocola TaxID=2082722 RepID=A0ABR9T4P4_9SPHI|nr:hypothetical protein [Sphingobacterium pedocola]MBE8719967.1 hypothetical protein [Sphingobacterium pedocola]
MNIYKTVIFSLLALFIVSCSKTETIKRPYNEVIKFSVAGYGSLDSVNAAISGDEIQVYWNSDNPLPIQIKPTIRVSEGATISPASGTEVEFSENTTYTVTAEDGTVRNYTIKPIVQQPIPILNSTNAINTSTSVLRWGTVRDFKLFGEYFLATDLSKVKVYGQRVKDGLEFDIPFDPETATSTSLDVKLPRLTAQQDTGWHKIWLKVGDLTSGHVDVYIRQPPTSLLTHGMHLEQIGQNVKLGQELTLNYALSDDFDGAVVRYFQNNFGATIGLNIQAVPRANGTVGVANISISNFTLADNKITFVLPTTATNAIGGYISSVTFLPKAPMVNRPTYTDNYSYQITPNKNTIIVAN